MTITPAFLVRAGGRLFRITALSESFTSCDDRWTPVDVRDLRTGFESQAIILTEACASRAAILEESQVRDAIRSAYMNATTIWANHRIVLSGPRLPDDFPVTIIGSL
jgi:hypothetical protein